VLLDHGADANTKLRRENCFDEGRSKPHGAMLLGIEADVNLQDSAGATALMWAVHRGYGAGLLLRAGADVNLKTEVVTRL